LRRKHGCYVYFVPSSYPPAPVLQATVWLFI
jgi:hypothetical protein